MIFENRYAIRRFIIKAALLTALGAVQWQRSFLSTTAMLFGFAGIFDVAFALMTRTPLKQSYLTYWDEAAVFLALSAFLIAAAYHSR